MSIEPAFRLADGRVFKLPALPDLTEFRLSGNWRFFPLAGMACFYDQTTATGATLFTENSFWVIQQPVTREHYWLYCELLASAQDSQAADALAVKH